MKKTDERMFFQNLRIISGHLSMPRVTSKVQQVGKESL